MISNVLTHLGKKVVIEVSELNKFLDIIFNRFPFIPFNKLLTRALNYYISVNRNRKIISTINGITYQLDLKEMIDSHLYYFGKHQKDISYILNKLCKKGMIALDIGANIGAYSFVMAKYVGETGKIIAFEPMSWAFLKLKKNYDLNSFQNITLEKIALSNESGEKSDVFKTSWVLNGTPQKNSLRKELIHFTTLDQYFNEKNIKNVDLIKLDVDGYEFRVLQGAINTLKKKMPIIILEVGIHTLKSVGDKVEDMISFVINLGYKIYSCKTFKEISDINELLNLIPKFKCIDVILSADPILFD